MRVFTTVLTLGMMSSILAAAVTMCRITTPSELKSSTSHVLYTASSLSDRGMRKRRKGVLSRLQKRDGLIAAICRNSGYGRFVKPVVPACRSCDVDHMTGIGPSMMTLLCRFIGCPSVACSDLVPIRFATDRISPAEGFIELECRLSLAERGTVVNVITDTYGIARM